MRIGLFTSSSSILEWYSVYILDSHETVVLRSMQVSVVYYRHNLLAHSQAPGSMLEWYSVYILDSREAVLLHGMQVSVMYYRHNLLAIHKLQVVCWNGIQYIYLILMRQ